MAAVAGSDSTGARIVVVVSALEDAVKPGTMAVRLPRMPDALDAVADGASVSTTIGDDVCAEDEMTGTVTLSADEVVGAGTIDDAAVRLAGALVDVSSAIVETVEAAGAAATVELGAAELLVPRMSSAGAKRRTEVSCWSLTCSKGREGRKRRGRRTKLAQDTAEAAGAGRGGGAARLVRGARADRCDRDARSLARGRARRRDRALCARRRVGGRRRGRRGLGLSDRGRRR